MKNASSNTHNTQKVAKKKHRKRLPTSLIDQQLYKIMSGKFDGRPWTAKQIANRFGFKVGRVREGIRRHLRKVHPDIEPNLRAVVGSYEPVFPCASCQHRICEAGKGCSLIEGYLRKVEPLPCLYSKRFIRTEFA